jgi:lysophospholipase L1-like esterase
MGARSIPFAGLAACICSSALIALAGVPACGGGGESAGHEGGAGAEAGRAGAPNGGGSGAGGRGGQSGAAGGTNEATAGAAGGGSSAGTGGTKGPDAGAVAGSDAGTTLGAFDNCIMTVGDSITQADVENASYRFWLWKSLHDAGRSFGFVGSQTARYRRAANEPTVPYPDQAFDADHEGYWGKTPAEILALMKMVRDWGKQTPGIVLLHAGTNEVWNAATTGVDVAADHARDGLNAIVDFVRSKNPRVRIFIAKVIPLKGHVDDAWGMAIDAINQRVATIATQKNQSDSPIVVVDQHTGFTDDDFLADGVHPNATGEKKIAARWLEAITPVLIGTDRRCDL